jgi:hypothetical protein
MLLAHFSMENFYFVSPKLKFINNINTALKSVDDLCNECRLTKFRFLMLNLECYIASLINIQRFFQ